MSVIIRSLVYSDENGNLFSVTIPRDAITLFPNSLLASTIELDPNVEVIEIPSLDVTPNSLDALKYIITHQNLPYDTPNEEFAKAGNYLGIDTLMLLADSMLQRFRYQYPSINLVNFDISNYGTVLTFAIANQSLYLTRYLFGLFSPEQTKSFDEIGLLTASKLGDVTTVDQLIRRRVDPSVKNNEAIQWAASKGHLAVVERLLQDPRVDPSSDENLGFREAVQRGHVEIVERLLKDPRVDPSALNNTPIRDASSRGYLAIVDKLLEDPRVNPSAEDNFAIRLAASYGHLAVVDRLLQDERVDPTARDNAAIRSAFRYRQVVDRLLQDPRVKATYQS